MQLEFPRKQIPLYAITLSLDDVKKIFERLLKQVREQADKEINALVKPAEQDAADFEAYKARAREQAFRITMTIRGKSGAELFGDDLGLFASPSLPENIVSVYMTNAVAYNGFAKVNPANAFELQLDFSKPALLDGSNLGSAPTPNVSRLVINGDRDSWVAAIEEAVTGVTKNRNNSRAWLHRAHLYDIALFVLGFPIASMSVGTYPNLSTEHLVRSIRFSRPPLISTFSLRPRGPIGSSSSTLNGHFQSSSLSHNATRRRGIAGSGM